MERTKKARNVIISKKNTVAWHLNALTYDIYTLIFDKFHISPDEEA